MRKVRFLAATDSESLRAEGEGGAESEIGIGIWECGPYRKLLYKNNISLNNFLLLKFIT